MVFGFSKSFVIFLFLSVLIAIATHNIWEGLFVFGMYALVKIIWNIFTK